MVAHICSYTKIPVLRFFERDGIEISNWLFV